MQFPQKEKEKKNSEHVSMNEPKAALNYSLWGQKQMPQPSSK